MPAFLALLAAVLLVSCPCPAAADAQDAAVSKVFRKTWEKFSDVSAEAAELAARPDRNDRTLLESLTGRESRYARLMRKAQDILSNAEARELFDDVAALQEKNLIVFRHIQKRTEISFRLIDNFLEHSGSMAHLHYRHSCALVIEHLLCRFFEHFLGKHCSTCTKVINSAHF